MAITQVDLATRHEATRHLMRTLRPNPALAGTARDVSVAIWETALALVSRLNDGPELSAGLRDLRRAKDAFVIQSLLDDGTISDP